MSDTSVAIRDITDDEAWADVAVEWAIRADTTYLNHGSFGPPPRKVRFNRLKWIEQLDEQPMDFYVRQLEEHMHNARSRVADFVGTTVENLVFAENATYGMNVVADSFPLNSGDEVLINNHEYGAVHRIWDRTCEKTGAKKVTVRLPDRIETEEQLIESLLKGVTKKTKLLVISHITSATAMILPIEKICAEFKDRGIAVCVDGPHAPAQVPLNLASLQCDFYTASCHKWLCGSLGSGFLFVAPKWHSVIQPIQKSWGRLLPAMPDRWDEEFTWPGTRDPSPHLSLPAAIDFVGEFGFEQFRARSRHLASYAEDQLVKLFGTQTWARRADGWYGSMAHVPIPPGEDWPHLQQEIWDHAQIEVPIIEFEGKWFVRVSCHLYNNKTQIDMLAKTLEALMR